NSSGIKLGSERLLSNQKEHDALVKEFRLYESYLNMDLDKIGKCAQFFRMYDKFVAEFQT
ncbi:7121_t:CDS:1, partial [Gigaspora rosea]